MAASPIAAFPYMRVLVTVHLYAYIRTNERADSTACAVAIIVKSGGHISGGIQIIRRGNAFRRAEFHAYLAALAELPVNFDVTFLFGFRIQNKLHMMRVFGTEF